MKKNQEENGRISDQLELLLGNTHRCNSCGQPIDQTVNSAGETEDQCLNCGSRVFIELEDLDKCRPS